MYRCQNWVSKLSRTIATLCIYTPRHGRLLVAYNVTENKRSLFYDTRKGTDGSCPVSTFPTLLVKCGCRKFATALSNTEKLNQMDVQNMHKETREIFDAAVRSVYPPQMVRNAVKLSED
ncbi:uncharacterized protein LOC132757944, partial [Ruditapes philippinarum]|uniref:uncharacterized protein LOC132757944 n=1 Tax=Ruditapes philippinarum TaxID=129788 RepID=UPI00295B28F4